MTKAPLPYGLSKLFEAHEPEARLQRVWRGIEARRRQRRFPPAIQTAVVAAAVGLLLSFGAVWWVDRGRANPNGTLPAASAGTKARSELAEVPTGGSVVVPGTLPRELDFGDGARVTVGSGGKLEVLEHSARSVALALRQGLAQFDIRPGGSRHWQIESGGVTVEVVGTQFSLERSSSTLRVEVQRGRVLVRGAQVPGQVQALNAGSVVTVPTVTDAPFSSCEAEAPAIGAAAPEPSAAIAALPPRAPTAQPNRGDGAPSWRSAATERDWGRAWRDLGADGVARQSQQTDDIADLFTLADVARLSGHPEAAVGPLRKIVEQHAGDARAGVAAFTLGRVWLDALHQPSQAVPAFENALALKLPATLAEDARARLVEALTRSGDAARARDAATLYRSQYPQGARRADVDQWSPPP